MTEGFQKKQEDGVRITRMKWLVPTGKSVVEASQMQVWLEDGSTYILDADWVQANSNDFKIKNFPSAA